MLKVRFRDSARCRLVEAQRGDRVGNAMIDPRRRGREHRVRLVGNRTKRVGLVPARAMRVNETAQMRREAAVECERATGGASEGVDARHPLGIEADADHGSGGIDRVHAIGRHDDGAATRATDGDLGIEREEQGDAMLRVRRRERSRRRADPHIIVEMGADPGIVQAPRRHPS